MKIKNWSRFQHFKDRRPPWIKLHREILDQRDISMISDRSFRVLVSLWLLASEDRDMEGKLPPVEDVAWRLRMDKDKLIKCLEELEPFVYQDDIKAISPRYQLDDPETETETETETRKRRTHFSKPTTQEVADYCQSRGNNIDPEAFVAYYDSKGWKVGSNPMKDWKAAVVTWEKRDKGNGQSREVWK